jgi:hypothetical protein
MLLVLLSKIPVTGVGLQSKTGERPQKKYFGHI